MNFYTGDIVYRGRQIRYQSAEKVWVFNIRTIDGKLERRVRNSRRAAKEEIDRNMREGK